MSEEGFSPERIRKQIHLWHPSWTQQQIDRALSNDPSLGKGRGTPPLPNLGIGASGQKHITTLKTGPVTIDVSGHASAEITGQFQNSRVQVHFDPHQKNGEISVSKGPFSLSDETLLSKLDISKLKSPSELKKLSKEAAKKGGFSETLRFTKHHDIEINLNEKHTKKQAHMSVPIHEAELSVTVTKNSKGHLEIEEKIEVSRTIKLPDGTRLKTSYAISVIATVKLNWKGGPSPLDVGLAVLEVLGVVAGLRLLRGGEEDPTSPIGRELGQPTFA